MRSRCPFLPVLGLIVSLATANHSWAGAITTFTLSQPTVSAKSATFHVSLTFTGAPADTVEALQLSVYGSSPALTKNDTDFTRFAFVPNSSSLPGWLEFSPISTGLVFYAPADPINGPFLSPSASPIDLGVLSVDLAGLSPKTSLLVTLNAGPSALNTDLGGTIGGTIVFSFAAADPAIVSLQFTQPSGVTFATPGPAPAAAVPEPRTIALAACGLLGAIVQRWRARRHRASWRSSLACRR
jgi:hypothetical protein